MADELVLYYAPRTRAFLGLWLLEELGRAYRLESFDLGSGRHKEADYLVMNPMGKVPMVVCGGRPVPELGVMAVYLSDLFSEAGLAPAIHDIDRADFLRWCFFSSAIIEPAMAQKMFGWEAKPSHVAWGSWDGMLRVVRGQLESGEPWLLGDKFSAADVLVGGSLRFAIMFGALEPGGLIGDYVARCEGRAGFGRAAAIETRESARFSG